MGTYALSLLIKMQINYNCLQLTSFRKYSLMLICCIVKKIHIRRHSSEAAMKTQNDENGNFECCNLVCSRRRPKNKIEKHQKFAEVHESLIAANQIS